MHLSGPNLRYSKWREEVIAHYGSLEAFRDRRSLEILRDMHARAIAEHEHVVATIEDAEARAEFESVFAEDATAARQHLAELEALITKLKG